MAEFNLNYEQKFEIDIDETGSTPDLQEIAAGITTVEFGNNEETDQSRYYDGDGSAETDIIGNQLVLTFSGHRLYGDPAQDFIMDKLTKIGANRRTDFNWTQPSGEKFEGNCTIANIQPGGGDAGAKGEISFEIHFNGKVTVTSGT